MINIIFSIYLLMLSNVLISKDKLTIQEKESFNVKSQRYEDALFDLKNSLNVELEELKKNKHFQRWDYFYGQRINTESKPDLNSILKEINLNENLNPKNQLLTSFINWEAIGPFNSPKNDIGLGRINVVKLHPFNSEIIYVGTASGGAWVSKDNAKTWELLPTTDYLSSSCSDIAISIINPNIIYLATSDVNSKNSISGEIYGIGILKSTDGGKSFYPTSKFHTLDENIFTNCIELNYNNDSILYVGTNKGVNISRDAGISFKIVGPNLYVNDLEIHPTNPNIIYFTTIESAKNLVKIYRTTDAGENWEIIQEYENADRAEITTSKSNPDMLVSIVAHSKFSSFHSFNLSVDKGETWNVQSNKDNHLNVLGRYKGLYPTTYSDQGWYDLCVGINPKNSNDVMVGGITLWSSSNKGEKFDELILNYHVDQHYIEYTPSGDTVYFANDGGLYRFIPKSNSYEFVSNGQNITQFYKLSVNPDNLEMVIAGAQDNNTMLKRANSNWYNVRSGDGMDCHFDFKDPRYIYASSQYGSVAYSSNGGDNFKESINTSIEDGEQAAWVTPIVIDPVKSGVLYVGYSNIWKNDNYGEQSSWKKISNFGLDFTIKVLAVSKSTPQYIYCSSGGNIHFTSDGGNSWNLIEKKLSSNVTGIAIHPNDPKKFYISLNSYSDESKVFEYDYKNNQWINLSGNLPNVPINTIVYQDNSPNRIFVGTDIGLYYSEYNTNYWEKYGKGLPYTIVTDIDLNYENKKLFVSTYGRGLWASELIDCNYPQNTIQSFDGSNMFCIGDSILLQVSDNGNKPDEIIWSNGKKGNEIWVKDENTYYAVLHFNSTNCKLRTNEIKTKFLSLPFVKIVSSKGDSICTGDSTKLSVNFGYKSYNWNDSITKSTRWVSKAGKYSVEVYNSNGCFDTDTITIYEKYLEKPKIIPLNNILTVDFSKNIQWYINDNLIENANSSTFKPDYDGEIKVEINDGICSRFSDIYNYYLNSITISNRISIFPNPTNGRILIKVNDDDVINEIKVTDMFGIELNIKPLYLNNKKEIELDLKSFTSGIYLIKLKLNNNYFNYKIVKL